MLETPDDLSLVHEPGKVAASDLSADQDDIALAPTLTVEQCDSSAVTIYLGATGARVRIPRALYDVLLAFEEPRTIASVTRGDARLTQAIDRLRQRGFLVGGTAVALPSPPRAVTDPPYRLFDCPAHTAAAGGADVVVIGVPYDGGDHAAAGARHGPVALRKASLQLLYGLDRRTGRPLGWFDADLGCTVLRGVTIGDAGDIRVISGEPQTRTFERLRGILDALIDDERRVCALLGGDATTSVPLVEAMQARGALGVLRIGGNANGSARAQPGFLSAATLPGRVLALPNVDRFVQVGTGTPADDTLPGFTAVAASDLLDRGVAALEPFLPAGRAVHLGLDMAVLAASTDEAGDRERLQYPQLRSLLREIGERYRVVSIDLVGINPSRRGWNVTGVAAVHLLLAMLDVTDRNGRGTRTA